MSDRRQLASGCLFGLALGDSLAEPVEFVSSVAQIRAEYGPHGPEAPFGDPATVTDDTQMTLAVGDALAQVADLGAPYNAATLEPALRRTFVAWSVSPENNRAPGMTCLSACRGLREGKVWQQATIIGSKGCGANMRVALVGLLPVDPITRAAIAQFQAALTHGHPTALAASDLTAHTVALLIEGAAPADLPARLRAYAHAQRTVYHAEWLGLLWQRTDAPTPEAFIARGWDECLAILTCLDNALVSPRRHDADPCLFTGEGWIAEEAFATALLCFLLHPEDPVVALRRATVTSGDSDSLACLTGAFAGARHGLAAWPDDWLRRIEYRDHLTALSQRWD